MHHMYYNIYLHNLKASEVKRIRKKIIQFLPFLMKISVTKLIMYEILYFSPKFLLLIKFICVFLSLL